jgi:HD-GYP domain-containing protein (c-di-GMP phosphodiesterase class II)
MLTRVPVADLKLGMHVVELDRPWLQVPFEPPFETQGFVIGSHRDLAKVREVCEYVVVEVPDAGHDGSVRIGDRRPIAGVPIPGYLLYGDLPDPVHERKASAGEEVPRARQALGEVRYVYHDVLHAIATGKRIDASVLRNTVHSLVDSVLRNPDAATLLVRMRKRDASAYSHAVSVCVLALTVGRHIGLAEDELGQLGMATLLQDVGKLRLRPELLDRPESLDRVGMQEIEQHVEHSLNMLMASGDLPSSVLEIVHSHHERTDGSGYPRRLRGKEITLAASISGLCDTYTALISTRPHRGPLTTFDALMQIYAMRSVAFPRALTERFIQSVGIFSVGSFVMLATGEICVVVERHRTRQLRPRVLVLLDEHGQPLSQARTLDLARADVEADSRHRIVKVVNPLDYSIDPAQFFSGQGGEAAASERGVGAAVQHGYSR